MKIGDPKAPVSLDRVDRTPVARAALPVDRVTADERRSLETVTLRAREVLNRSRAERLDGLKAQIEAGTYRPDTGRLAEEILRDAEIEAMLRALLRGIG
jgi:negative regulator of flagellin synthesis FlgM